MDKKLVLEQLINHFTDGNQRQFAKIIGVDPTTVNSWLKRETYDTERLYQKLDGISSHYLLTGEGDMLASESSRQGYTINNTITTQKDNHGNIASGAGARIEINETKPEFNDQKIDILTQKIEMLEKILEGQKNLLEEKERMIKFLMEKL